MSDACIYPVHSPWESLNYTKVLDDKWTVDEYGFPDIDFFIDAVVRYPKEAVHKCLFINHKYPVVCRYPSEITLDGDGN
jgi:hypothetical protein